METPPAPPSGPCGGQAVPLASSRTSQSLCWVCPGELGPQWAVVWNQSHTGEGGREEGLPVSGPRCWEPNTPRGSPSVTGRLCGETEAQKFLGPTGATQHHT